MFEKMNLLRLLPSRQGMRSALHSCWNYINNNQCVVSTRSPQTVTSSSQWHDILRLSMKKRIKVRYMGWNTISKKNYHGYDHASMGNITI